MYVSSDKKKRDRLNLSFCTPAGVRTLDTLIKSQVLYQLSYGCIYQRIKSAFLDLRLQKYNVFFEPPNFFPYFFNFISSYLFFRTFRTGYRDTLNWLSGHFELIIRTGCPGHPDGVSGPSGQSVRPHPDKVSGPPSDRQTPFNASFIVFVHHSSCLMPNDFGMGVFTSFFVSLFPHFASFFEGKTSI